MAIAAKVEAGWTCSVCGRTTARLAVHHVRPVETGRTAEEMEGLCYDTANLQVLCYECHSKVHEGTRGKAGHQERQRMAAARMRDAMERADFGSLPDF